MKKKLIIAGITMLILASCSKKAEQTSIDKQDKKDTSGIVAKTYTEYTIFKGQQYCDKSIYVPVKCSEISFKVKFDSSAIYTTINKKNQSDINKLFGFSDNNAAHHEFSARFGWRWSDNALRLFAYDYNNSVMSFKELGTIRIGVENDCSIKVSGDKYIFTLNGIETTMPRASTTAVAEGYKLFPYFGGNELAPHNISIWIEEL
jgi:hypothetical protein